MAVGTKCSEIWRICSPKPGITRSATASGRGAIGARVVGGFGLSSNRELDEVEAAMGSAAEPGAVVG